MDNTERRIAERHPAGDNRARLLWDEGPEVLETPVRLIDISRDGARFVAEIPPPPGHDVCFRLESPRKSGWVLATVVRHYGSTEGGLSFSRYCPHDLMTNLT